jgi:hypothetical protein
MKLRDHFPRTATAYPGIPLWDEEFEWARNAPGLVEVMQFLQVQFLEAGDQALLEFSNTLRDDLIAETETVVDPAAAAMIDGMRFIVAYLPMQCTLTTGRLGECYSWTLWGISRSHDPNARINYAEYQLPPYEAASAIMNDGIMPFVVGWAYCAYLLARKFGGLDGICTDVFDHCYARALRAINGGDIRAGVLAAVAMANWANQRNHPKAEALTLELLRLFREPALPHRLKVDIGMLFVSPAAKWTGQLPIGWAQQLLSNYKGAMIEHEVLQVMAVTTDSLEAWNSKKAEILAEVRFLADHYRAGRSAMNAVVALESRVSIIHPFIYCLTKFGSTGDIMDILWAWYGKPGRERADDNILFVSPNHGDGVAYVWPTGRWFAAGNDIWDSLEALLTSVSEALNDYFRGPAGDRERLFDERMAGAPAFEHAGPLLARMEEHYHLEQLARQLPAGFVPRSIVVLPAHRDPLQSLLAKAVGWLAPLEASLAKAERDREIKVVSIWPGETQLTEPEVEAVVAVGRLAGWVAKVRSGALDGAAFREFYEDPEADVLWVIGHGEQSPYRIEETGLVMEGHVLLPMPEIAEYKVPDAGRRLLVLNVCSSGSAQTMDGMARIGLGQELASPNQRVVAHLWPIDYYAALAFGCALASRLRHEDANSAMRSAIEIMADQARLLDEITGISGGLQAVNRLSPAHVASHLQSVLSWGCPALLI